MELEFEINNQSMNRIDKNKPADFSNKYLLCKFNFLSNDWSEDFTKFAIFKTNNANYRVTILEDECYVPFDVLEHRRFVITVYGVNAEDVRITTNQVWLRLEDSGFVTSYDESGEFNPDMTEQIWLAMEGKVDKVTGKALSTHDFTDYYKNFIDGFDGDIEAFLEEHKEEIEALITSEVLDGKADKVHSHLKSDISDFAHNHDDRYYTETEIDSTFDGVDNAIGELWDTKSDTGHTHDKSDITDFSHTHTEADITDLQDYALASGVYSKAEVDALIDKVENKFFVTSDSPVIQTGENTELYAKMKKDGFPVPNKTIHFYEIMEGVIYYQKEGENYDIDLGVSEYNLFMDANTTSSIQIGTSKSNTLNWGLPGLGVWNEGIEILNTEYYGEYIKIQNNILYYGENSLDLSEYNIDLSFLRFVDGEVLIKELEEED